ncbi:MAG: hypothetical protein JWO20_2717 [Candidatus Angelobacter sp.]|jgi:hypothetical protein|nr:hypothetical protein [Candidatus Angelobacter sp.]
MNLTGFGEGTITKADRVREAIATFRAEKSAATQN